MSIVRMYFREYHKHFVQGHFDSWFRPIY